MDTLEIRSELVSLIDRIPHFKHWDQDSYLPPVIQQAKDLIKAIDKKRVDLADLYEAKQLIDSLPEIDEYDQIMYEDEEFTTELNADDNGED